MNVSLENTDQLNATLTVEIAREDYEPKFNESLKKFRKNGQFKGFRKGKTPMGYIKKIYGEAALAEAVNDLLQKTVSEYLVEHDVNFLGQPIPAPDQRPIMFDPRELETYEFKFDLGMAPEFEVQGLDADIRRFDVEIADEKVNEQWEGYLKQLGTSEDTDSFPEEGDVIFLKATELVDGEPKEEGVESSFAVRYDDLATDELKAELSGLKAGDSFNFDPMNLEAGRDEAFVRKYHLGLEEEPDREISSEFKAEIERVQRAKAAEINQELFDRMFGEGKIESEEQAKDEIRQSIKADLDRRADAVLYKEMQKSLMDTNAMELPEEFLQRWLDSQRRENEPEPTEQDRADFLLDLKWQLIKDKIARANELKVENEEIEEGAYRRVYQYIGPYGDPDTLRRLVTTILGNRDQVSSISREVMANKVFEVLKESFKIQNESIAEEAFVEQSDAILQPINA